MLPPESLALFALASLVLALTPGPNWAYLLSRTLAQGRRAGIVSWAGTTCGLSFHMIFASLGLSAVLLAVPYAYDAIRLAGAAYLLWLAWTTVRGARGAMLAPVSLPPVPDRVLFRQGMVSSVLNPKVALFYLALLPQFIDPARGPVLAQGLVLGLVQIAVTAAVDVGLVLVAAELAQRIARRPGWIAMQRWFLGSVFGALAVWLALDRKSA
ncbi:MAG: LysE family translocator [Burkholderiales bacterium]|jgi:threonine/homoserine/homoserine lactone efflux protein|nr:LysE family translocator [Burkholderiales bacterium]